MVGFGAGLWWPGPEKKRYGQTAPLGAAAVDEVAYVAAILDAIHAQRDLSQVEAPEDMSIINLLTGTSAGALTAIYFANLHDSYCKPRDND